MCFYSQIKKYRNNLIHSIILQEKISVGGSMIFLNQTANGDGSKQHPSSDKSQEICQWHCNY